MATGEIVPNADVAVAWNVVGGTGTHESAIDEPRGSPSTADYIYAAQIEGDDNLVDDFNMSTLTIYSATQVVVYAYCKAVLTYGGDAEVDFYDGNTWRGYQSLGAPISETFFEWRSKTFSGLSMTQANLNACRVRFRADVPADKSRVDIACVYAVVTYTPPGYGHDFIGIPAVNIDNIMGIPTLNIDNIMGL